MMGWRTGWAVLDQPFPHGLGMPGWERSQPGVTIRRLGCYGVGVAADAGVQAGNPANGCPAALCGSTFRRR
jgi:hypothetical protein